MAHLGTPDTNHDLVDIPGNLAENLLMTIMVWLEPPDIECPAHFDTTIFAILAAKAPAVNPESMLTTAMTEQDWSILARAALPWPIYP
jgi:hypothetical protein